MAKRTGEKYAAIINAAVKVIARHGYYNAQVSKIAREAEVADGTIYLYFKNKDDILTSLFREKMGRFIQDTEQALTQINDPSEQLKTIIRMHFHHLQIDPELAVVTQIELRQPNPHMRKQIGHIVKPYLNMIDRVIRAGQESGIFRRQVDVKIARKMVFGTLDETVTSWIMNDRKYALLDMADSIHDLFLHGLSEK